MFALVREPGCATGPAVGVLTPYSPGTSEMENFQGVAAVSHLAQLFLIPQHFFFANGTCKFTAKQAHGAAPGAGCRGRDVWW